MNQRRFGVVALSGLPPWVIVTWDGGLYPIFSVGFASVMPFSFTTLPEYLAQVGTVPVHLDAWPLATLVYTIGLIASASEKVRDTIVAGILVLAAFDIGLLAASISSQRGVFAFPIGVLWLLLASVWIVYGERLTSIYTTESV